jgi:hypothetical protein
MKAACTRTGPEGRAARGALEVDRGSARLDCVFPSTAFMRYGVICIGKRGACGREMTMREAGEARETTANPAGSSMQIFAPKSAGFASFNPILKQYIANYFYFIARFSFLTRLRTTTNAFFSSDLSQPKHGECWGIFFTKMTYTKHSCLYLLMYAGKSHSLSRNPSALVTSPPSYPSALLFPFSSSPSRAPCPRILSPPLSSRPSRGRWPNCRRIPARASG